MSRRHFIHLSHEFVGGHYAFLCAAATPSLSRLRPSTELHVQET
jgi:hypothetical protein